MAVHRCRLVGLLARPTKTRYLFPHARSSVSLFPFSTLEPQPKPLNDTNGQSNRGESYVLNELSALLPISVAKPINLYKPDHANKRAAESGAAIDGLLLSPEEKLRGVFLQKLKGKFAIERALSDAGVDLSLDVVCRVLNWGSLGGEAMVTFFKWATKQPAVEKDVRSYNALIRALGRRKFIDVMVGALRDMRSEDVEPDLETLSIVVDSLVRARRVYKAIELFERSEEFGFGRDAESLNVLLQCLCRRSHVGAANSYLTSMKGRMGFNSTSYNIIVGGWSKYGRVSEIERVLEAMVEDGLSPDCSTFSYVIEGFGRAGRIDDAVKIFDNMKETGCVPDTSVYNAMISNLISTGDFSECMKYYRCLLDSGCDPNVDTFTKLISAFIKARKVADALEMFDEMLSRGAIPATGAITSFIEPLCSFGPPYAAMVIYKKARKVGCKVSATAYKLLLMRLSRFGKCGMLLDIWDEMRESGCSSDMEVYEYVINGLCNIGQLENAVLVMEESLQKGFCPSRLIYSKVNNKLLASNKVEMAYKLFLKIKDARRHDNARRFWRANGWHF